MSRTKKPTGNQQPIVSPRERELLDELDLIKRANLKITVIGFCKRVGYANKSALRHFPVLRRELSLYIAQFSKPEQKRQAPSGAKYFETQIARQNLAIDRLRRQVKTIPTLKAKVAMLETKAKQDSEDKRQLRGMLSTVIAFLSGSDFAKARDLSERLEKQAKELLEDKHNGCIEEEN
jgi:hypothetical protein